MVSTNENKNQKTTKTSSSLQMVLTLIKRFVLLRPSFYIGIITGIAYWDTQALHGTLVYDDAGSIKGNIVVTGAVPWTEVFVRDFWGTKMSEPQSHKSFRPITTLSFKVNYLFALPKDDDENQGNPGKKFQEMNMFGFHIVNLILHCAVTALVTEIAYYVFQSSTTPIPLTNKDTTVSTIISTTRNSQDEVIALGQIITGSIFGLHPVHVEAVTNITSRGELLMSFFYLLAFLSYVQSIPKPMSHEDARTTSFSLTSFIGIYIVPCLCLIASMFSKEQGVTALLTIIVYDFIQHHYSVVTYLRNFYKVVFHTTAATSQLSSNDNNSIVKIKSTTISFLRRAVVLLAQTAMVAYWRHWLNGVTKPDFIREQNPAGFAPERFTRMLSIPYVYCLYIYDYLYPMYLGPDWSGTSIDLITSSGDLRIIGVLLLWAFTAICLYSLIFDTTSKHPVSSSLLVYQDSRRIILHAFFAFALCPFLLSSNLFVVVGLMKADRVMYLPLMGLALFEAWFVTRIFYREESIFDENKKGDTPKSRSIPGLIWWRLIGYVLVILQLSLLTGKLHERNVAWSHSLNLWTSAYNLNSRSKHTMYNCGYELSIKERYREAEYVLRPVGNPYVDSPNDTFVYAMVLFNLNRCAEASPLLELALELIEERRIAGGPRNSEGSTARTKSNLLVAQAYCTVDNIALSGQRFYNAVQADPTNEYAIEQANNMVQRMEKLKLIEQHREQMGLESI
jgi:Domain of unknown function (DUF1736)